MAVAGLLMPIETTNPKNDGAEDGMEAKGETLGTSVGAEVIMLSQWYKKIEITSENIVNQNWLKKIEYFLDESIKENLAYQYKYPAALCIWQFATMQKTCRLPVRTLYCCKFVMNIPSNKIHLFEEEFFQNNWRE